MIRLCEPDIHAEYRVEDFEEALAKYLGVEYVVCTNSGTSALQIAVACAFTERREMITVSPNAFIAAPNAVRLSGKDPIPSARPELVVHLFGMFETGHGVVADACQCFGAEHNGQKIGTEAKIACYSFNWNKIITCGSGGCIATNYKIYDFIARHISGQCKVNELYYIHTGIGDNYKMNALQASLGMEGLKDIDDRVARKRDIAAYYADRMPGFRTEPLGTLSNYWLSTVYVKKRDKIMQYMIEKGIEVRAMYAPWSETITKEHRELMCLPSSLNITRKEQDKVIKTFEEACNAADPL